jgi:hypothetical protein
MPASFYDFLRGRLDADHGWATNVLEFGSPNDHGIARRTIADIESKRQIVALHDFEDVTSFEPGGIERSSDICKACGEDAPCPTLRWLAASFDQDPDYMARWKP